MGLLLLAACSVHAAHTQARLVLEKESARPGDTVMAGIHLRMDPGWHTYWRNSGGSGIPTGIQWELPPGITNGKAQWPIPKKEPEQEFTTYTHSNEVVIFVPLQLAPDLPPGSVQLKAHVSWLECQTSCIPGETNVNATLTIGSETKPSPDAALLAAWQKKLPNTNNDVAAHVWWQKAPSGDTRPLILEWKSSSSATEADFFPDSSEQFEIQPQTEKLAAAPGTIRLRAQVKKMDAQWPRQVSGLLLEKSQGAETAHDLILPVSASGSASEPVGSGGGQTGISVKHSLWSILLYAFLGGLILNIMPCVLPVIALKILGFVNEAQNDPGHVRKLGLIYTAGVLCSFLALALIIVGLQRAGEGAGWGFQFGNPYFLIAMTALVTLIALNLFGVFDVNLGSGALNAASGLASKQGAAGAFFNGFLATVLATSCSAPILATALGFTSSLKNPLIAILVMLTVGAGLAAPYLVLSCQPSWLRFLPKPGTWMQRFKVAMGFPMMAAAVWLCSLIRVHYGDRAWWMAMFLVFVAVAAWIYGEFVQRGSTHRGVAILFSLGLMIVGFAYALEKGMRWREPLTEAAAAREPSRVAPRGIAWEKWSPEAVAAARSAGRPVVVDFTATWCPNCNVIVKPTFENAAVQKKLREVNAVTLVADYSLLPKSISDELQRFERNAVPFVLVYPRKAEEPPMTFDLVWPGTMLEALDRAAQ